MNDKTCPICCRTEDEAKHISDLLQAEKENRLIILPCIIGATVWLIKSAYSLAKSPIEANHVSVCGINRDHVIMYSATVVSTNSTKRFTSCDIGKTVFLAYEEAEAAIKAAEWSEKWM